MGMSPASAAGTAKPHSTMSGLKPSAVGGLQVLATGLDNPRHLTIGPDGNLYVAEAGHGGTTADPCYNTTDPESGDATTNCAGPTGAIARITPAGVMSTALGGLTSVADPSNPEGAAGPAAVSFVGGKLQVVMQEAGVAPYDADPAHGIPANPNHDGSNPYG